MNKYQNKVIYQRNHRGEYVTGISKAKIGLFSVLSVFIIGGFVHSAIAARNELTLDDQRILEKEENENIITRRSYTT